jgi:osmotically-inducible protein OsmY
MKNSTVSALKLILVTSGLILGPTLTRAIAQQDQQQAPAPDNTKTNRDTNKSTPSADQQKMNPADRETTKQIRAAIMQDKSISTYAHNIKIVTRDGKVTLKGPVRTEEEKASIETKAAAVAGADNVTNGLTVAPKAQ